jgi:para-nitrobenzyl esterase
MTQSPQDAEILGTKFAEHLGAKSIGELRALDAKRLLLPPDAPPALQFGPVVDGWFMPTDAETIYAQHQQNDVPLLIGMMADEGSAFPGYSADQAARQRKQGIASLDKLLTQRAQTSHQPAYETGAAAFNSSSPAS